MRIGEILAILSDEYSNIQYDDKRREFKIDEYTFSPWKNDQLLVSYCVWKGEDDCEDFEDVIDATPEAVEQVIAHDPSWWKDSWSYDDIR